MACKRFPNLGIVHGYWNILTAIVVINKKLFPWIPPGTFLKYLIFGKKDKMNNQILGCLFDFFSDKSIVMFGKLGV